MIHNIITSIAGRVNQYIKNKLSIDEDIIIVRSLVDAKGNISQGIENKIVVFEFGFGRVVKHIMNIYYF